MRRNKLTAFNVRIFADLDENYIFMCDVHTDNAYQAANIAQQIAAENGVILPDNIRIIVNFA